MCRSQWQILIRGHRGDFWSGDGEQSRAQRVASVIKARAFGMSRGLDVAGTGDVCGRLAAFHITPRFLCGENGEQP